MPGAHVKTARDDKQRLAATEERPVPTDAGATSEPARSTETVPEPAVTLRNMEKLLAQIRGALDAAARDREHREFSIGRTIGSILQVIVVGLTALALLDWLLDGPLRSLYTKLAFAAVLQLAALTAFVVSRARS